jgi:hypothetical protein
LASFALLVGCNEVFDLAPTGTAPADEDGDGIADLDDNCRAIANPDQEDADRDVRGDLCDDCPLVANAPADLDGDRIGDACDPRPDRAGDCLLLLDTFRDPAAFDAGWTVLPAGASVVTAPGHVVLEPPDTGDTIGIAARNTSGLADVSVLGTATGPTATISAAANIEDLGYQLYRCRLHVDSVTFEAKGPGTGILPVRDMFPRVAVGNSFALRLIVDDTGMGVTPITVGCRADFGLAVGADFGGFEAPMMPAPAGVLVNADEVTIDAVAIMQYRPGTSCPMTVYR